MDGKFTVLDRHPQVVFELEPLHQGFVHLRLKYYVMSLAVILCAVHREVGVSEQVIGRQSFGTALRDSDARGHKYVFALDNKWLFENGPDAFGDHHRLLRAVDRFDQNCKFVSAEPCCRIARS